MKRIKKLSVLAIGLTMLFSLAACGSDDKASSSSPATSTAPIASSKPATSNAPAASGGGSGTKRDATALKSELIEGYMGVSENGEFMYYAGNDDGSRALLMFYNPANAEHYVFAGPVTVSDEEGYLSITDEQDNLGLLFAVEEVDGGIVLEMGDLGSAILGEASVEDVVAAMLAIEDGTSPVTPGENGGGDEELEDEEVGDEELLDEEMLEDEELIEDEE